MRRLNNLTVKKKIDQAIEDLSKQHESIRNITYKSWIDKVTNGEKLYPNEDLFAKNIVKKANYKAKSAAKCLKDLKLLSIQLRISLSEKKFKAQLDEGVRRNLENVLSKRRSTFIIKKPQVIPQKTLRFDEITTLSARNLLDASQRDLNFLATTLKFNRK
jgi:hypothetical protein